MQAQPNLIRINRYIVGCKQVKLVIVVYACEELIDTQWDVNQLSSGGWIAGTPELIDTQWDVNVFDITKLGSCGMN